MFETANLSYGKTTRRLWQTCLGVTGEVILLGCAVLVPVLSPQVLPRAVLTTMLAPPGVPPPAPPPGPVVRPRGPRISRQLSSDVLFAPDRVPTVTPTIVDAPRIEATVGLGIEGGIPGAIGTSASGGIISSILSAATLVAPAAPRAMHAPPPDEPAPAPPKRIRLGGGVRMAETVYRPEPLYPPLARQMRVSGTVELVGVIGVDGRLRELRVVSGHPLLARAALEAVSKWIYQPTLLNGDPVEVIAPITVTFRLN
jgi:protein TonB